MGLTIKVIDEYDEGKIYYEKYICNELKVHPFMTLPNGSFITLYDSNGDNPTTYKIISRKIVCYPSEQPAFENDVIYYYIKVQSSKYW